MCALFVCLFVLSQARHGQAWAGTARRTQGDAPARARVELHFHFMCSPHPRPVKTAACRPLSLGTDCRSSSLPTRPSVTLPSRNFVRCAHTIRLFFYYVYCTVPLAGAHLWNTEFAGLAPDEVRSQDPFFHLFAIFRGAEHNCYCTAVVPTPGFTPAEIGVAMSLGWL
jgi:hypothetical protein